MGLITTLNRRILQVLGPHNDLFDKIDKGETRFRTQRHFVYESIDVDDPAEFTPEEWAAKQAVLESFALKEVRQE